MINKAKIKSVVKLRKSSASCREAKAPRAAIPITNVPNGKRTSLTEVTEKSRQDDAPPAAGRSSCGSTNGDAMTSSVVATLAERGGARGRRGQESGGNNGAIPNRADRLQVMLNTLEREMGWLHHREQQLEQRLSKFLTQRSSLSLTIDDLHLRLDALARAHSTFSKREASKAKKL